MNICKKKMTIFKHCSKIFSDCKIISNNFEDVSLEQIIIDKYIDLH